MERHQRTVARGQSSWRTSNGYEKLHFVALQVPGEYYWRNHEIMFARKNKYTPGAFLHRLVGAMFYTATWQNIIARVCGGFTAPQHSKGHIYMIRHRTYIWTYGQWNTRWYECKLLAPFNPHLRHRNVVHGLSPKETGTTNRYCRWMALFYQKSTQEMKKDGDWFPN